MAGFTLYSSRLGGGGQCHGGPDREFGSPGDCTSGGPVPAIRETTRQTAPGPLVRPRAGESSGHFPQTRGQQGVSGSDCSVFPCQPVTSGAISAPTGRKGSQSVTKQARSRRKAEQGDETPSRPENHSVRTKGGREGEEGEVPRGELGLIQGAAVLWSPERRVLLLGGHRHPGS